MADDVIVLTVPMWHALNAAKAWYRAKAIEGDPDMLEQAENRLFDAVRTLEMTEALERAARRNGRPVQAKAKKPRTTSMRPPPMPEPEPVRAKLRVLEGGKTKIRSTDG